MTTSALGARFASDNTAGIHPVVLAAVGEANGGAPSSYGDDDWTEALAQLIREHFGSQAVGYCTFNGTGANVLAVQAMTRSWQSVVCSDVAHLGSDEGGAIERVAGLAVSRVPQDDGRIDLDRALALTSAMGDRHRAQPRVLSLTQATEYGTCYSRDEMAVACERAHAAGWLVHVDGARLANAAAALGCSLADLTTHVGVDVVSFGGTKNGLLAGECVVVLQPEAAAGVEYLRKGTAQLASKMRFLSAQFVALLRHDLWLHNASHANAMAASLAGRVAAVPGFGISRPVETNAVFATVPADAVDLLRGCGLYHCWDSARREVRWMTSFETSVDELAEFERVLKTAVQPRDVRPAAAG